MKILLISNAVYGGAGKACLRLYKALQNRGEDVKLLKLEGQQSDDPNIVSFYPNVRELFLRQVWSSPSKALKHMLLGDFARQYRLPSSVHSLERHPLIEWADIINLHWVPDFLDYRRFFSRIRAKPVVWTLHDMLPFSGGFHYELDLANRNSDVERRIEKVKISSVKRSNLAIVAPSKWLVDISGRESVFGGKLHRHIFNGLSLDVYHPIDRLLAREVMGLPKDCKIVLFVADGVGSVRKGGDYLVEALKNLECKDPLLLSIGKGSIEIGHEVNHKHLGSFSDDISMVLAYSSADVVLVPSVEDNSPNIILESFACGRPVVAFDVGGIRELVCESFLGVLAREVGAVALAEAIDTALSTDFKSDLIRQNAEIRFADTVLSKNYQKLFSQVTKL